MGGGNSKFLELRQHFWRKRGVEVVSDHHTPLERPKDALRRLNGYEFGNDVTVISNCDLLATAHFVQRVGHGNTQILNVKLCSHVRKSYHGCARGYSGRAPALPQLLKRVWLS